ncbi:uncharacterized protein LOC133916168 isoform X2 [Phragmites australis]|uniref:uncharacterized protein LOC133916168 isoform X2 n=1 Tax=Phragmites australis TaxID=29695 RepID=UPI002D779480|nr:uncharacterized protein LOC133916168 isoform X2 [Phragmites australis]
MDAKKKRNKKKKGNQGKNTGDVTGEAAPQDHNHESAPTDNNHEPTPQTDHNGTSAHDTTSSVGEGIPCYENNESTMTQENHKVSNAIPADQRSIGMSESSVELDVHRLNDAKLDKLHETIKHLEDEKSLWLQKVSILDSELEKLNNKVGCHSQNEVLLEEKLNSLQNGYDLLVKKEEVLDSKVRRIEDINDTLTHQEASLKERLSGLEETNKALQSQVLEETSNSTVEENQRLVKSLNELDSRVQALEAKAALSEASITEKVPEFKVMDQMDLTGSVLHQPTTGFTEVIGKGNEMIADRGLNSSVTIISDSNYSQINNSHSNVYASNHQEEASTQLREKVSNNSTAQCLIDANERQFDEPRMSEEIVPVPLDDIQIHEDDDQQSGEDETAEVPFSDAPIIGAPFRLISFVARYVSGADLVSEK